MAYTARLYGNMLIKAFNKEIDWDADTIKCMLCSNTYSPDQELDDYVNDVSGNEISGTGYTAGGATLASKTSSYNAGSKTIKFDAADITWASSTLTARYGIIYVDTGTPSTSTLIGYIDFGEDISTSGEDFKITFDSAGVFSFSIE